MNIIILMRMCVCVCLSGLIYEHQSFMRSKVYFNELKIMKIKI
jgi:hypothetical protein